MRLDRRELVGELMDDPALDAREHEQALRGLARLNRLSNASGPIVRAISAHDSRRDATLLDVASGSGDVLMHVLRSVPDVCAHACDISPVACHRIESRAASAGLPVRVVEVDALSPGSLGDGAYDVVMNALFLHHLERDDALRLLRSMREALAPGGLLVISDLLRTRLNYAMALAASRLVTRSGVVHTDALLSVRAAFSMEEARSLAADAGLVGAVLRRVWPERFLLTWVKS